MKLLRRLFFIILLVSVPLFSFAEIALPGGSQPVISSELTPETVRSFSSGTVSISSSYVFLDSATIRWSIDGKVIKEGVGATEAEFSVGPIGVPVNIVASIKALNGISYDKEIVVLPGNVDFITQAKTYTPPFFKGKAVFTGESKLTITAFADITNQGGGIFDPSTLLYEWSVDDTAVRDQSGYNKKSLTFKGTMWDKPQKVSVYISSLDGSITAKYSEVFTPANPEILIYEESPLLGTLFNRVVTSPFLIDQGKEVTFFAAPFNIISESLTTGTTYTWKMNGSTVNNQGNGNVITFRDDSGKTGESNILVKIGQESNLFQTAQKNFTIQFK